MRSASRPRPPRDLHSSPTRRSSDLPTGSMTTGRQFPAALLLAATGKVFILGGKSSSGFPLASAELYDPYSGTDRKSTRLNSSHVEISYAVFCLKKKSSREPRFLSAA